MDNVQLIVTAAIIEKENKFLLTKRLAEKHNGNRWEFPGGKVEFGEDPKTCLKREIEEELGIVIEVLEPFEFSSCIYDEYKQIILLGFHCNYVSGEIEKKDIADFVWVSPKEALKLPIEPYTKKQ